MVEIIEINKITVRMIGRDKKRRNEIKNEEEIEEIERSIKRNKKQTEKELCNDQMILSESDSLYFQIEEAILQTVTKRGREKSC
jgi:hypothetical protein